MRKRLGGSRKWKRGWQRAELNSRDRNRSFRRSDRQKLAQLPLKYRRGSDRHSREPATRPVATTLPPTFRLLKIAAARQIISPGTQETAAAIAGTVDALLASDVLQS